MKQKKDKPITFRPSSSTKDALNKLAYQEDRPISRIIERCVRESLKLDNK